jgi:tetratricopeptide (TPR) repeat protein
VDGTDAGKPLVLFDLARQPPAGEALERQAQRALLAAARDRQTPAAAEAMYLLAHHEAAAGRALDAMRLYGNLAEAFGTSKDPVLRAWVQRAIRGIGDAMMAVRQYQDARGVYLSYLGRAAADDPDLPAVYLATAEAGRQLGLARQDVVALDEAIDLLHTMLDRFAKVPAAAAEVQLARLTLGELLFDAGRHAEAEAQLKLVAAKSGGAAPDQLAFWLAECAFQLGRVDEARPIYERLGRAWAAGKQDARAAGGLYATAAYRLGQCHLRRAEPQYVLALFAFLKARQDFPRSPLDAELLIGIARCYAELERTDDTVNALWELLKQDGVADEPQRRLRFDRLLGDLEGQLADYAGPVRAKILFYIAQADYRRAQRDRAGRAAAAAAAVSHYERVLAEQPPLDLAHAAKLALARAAQLGGQEARAAQALKELLREPSLSPRDRETAALQLGTYYRAQGRLRDAIRAYRGEVPEP